MNNLLCIPKDKLVQIFWRQSTDGRLRKLFEKFQEQYSLQEMHDQVEAGKGEVGEYFKKELEIFSKKTTHEEIAHAVTLADFYFPKSNPMICFEMKSEFQQQEIETLRELLENMESNTEIDCLIKQNDQEFKFQLKQYPEKYKEWSVSKVIDYIDEEVLPKYESKANEDLIIIIAIKPEMQSQVKGVEDFKAIHEHLKTRGAKIKEVDFLYNINNQFIIWHQVYPLRGHSKIPWQELSYHNAKRNKSA